MLFLIYIKLLKKRKVNHSRRKKFRRGQIKNKYLNKSLNSCRDNHNYIHQFTLKVYRSWQLKAYLYSQNVCDFIKCDFAFESIYIYCRVRLLYFPPIFLRFPEHIYHLYRHVYNNPKDIL